MLNTYCIGKAVAAGLPIINTEFGWYASAARPYPDPKSEPRWEHQMADYLSIINKWETNWMTYAWWANPDNLGLATSNYASLSPQGQVWVQYLGSGHLLKVESSPVTNIPFTITKL